MSVSNKHGALNLEKPYIFVKKKKKKKKKEEEGCELGIPGKKLYSTKNKWSKRNTSPTTVKARRGKVGVFLYVSVSFLLL